ncbi:single-stranded DNA-binding protein [Blastococcus sp. KM273129]|uniref:single-stranded DNA-binding protein n=1 Tax=Blastococcus sp. KM273129 TaxID=2570315 RepID=UPI001F025B2E|nr:single-stranded DNA-binding protein [Blastococcus sp. KM273129]MCF6734496.1 single-stranded DNA-binding protein [Blastococcus sp. KM273129]
MNDTYITVVGNVADDPRRKVTEKGAVTNFRMASTARRYDSGSGEYVDSGTFWIDVECWNGLSSNVAGSVSKGDPVIVQGTLTTHEWESDNGTRRKPQLRATAVGPNLAKGMAVFKRDRSGRVPGVPAGQDPAAGLEGRAGTEVPDAGWDYHGDGATLSPLDGPDLPQEPAHA